MFGGGGYVDLVIDHRGIRTLEASIEFGAALEVNFFVARAEVHVLGAIRYVQTGGPGGVVRVAGSLRMGGCIEILGLISVSVELEVMLSYDGGSNALVGRATLVLELDLTLYSTSVELDTGPWRIAGGGAGAAPDSVVRMDAATPTPRVDPDVFVETWHAYRGAFA
jgi:hypothetical protein